MNSTVVTMAIMIGIVFFVIKMIEMRVLHEINGENDQENKIKPAKILMGDCILVSISVLAGYLLLDQSSPFTLTNSYPMDFFLNSPNTLGFGTEKVIRNDDTTKKSPMVFTDNPDF